MRARSRAIRGATQKGRKFEREGGGSSFRRSLAASAKGWGRPIRETLFGPLRSWK